MFHQTLIEISGIALLGLVIVASFTARQISISVRTIFATVSWNG